MVFITISNSRRTEVAHHQIRCDDKATVDNDNDNNDDDVERPPFALNYRHR